MVSLRFTPLHDLAQFGLFEQGRYFCVFLPRGLRADHIMYPRHDLFGTGIFTDQARGGGARGLCLGRHI